MGIDVVNVSRIDSCIPNGGNHGFSGTLAIRWWRGDVIRVTAHPETDEFAVNSGAAGFGMLQLFKHDAACPVA